MLATDGDFVKAAFFRVLASRDKAADLSMLMTDRGAGPGRRFDVDPQDLAGIHGSPFAYWLSESTRALYSSIPPFKSPDRTVKIGLQTSNDYRFLRLG